MERNVRNSMKKMSRGCTTLTILLTKVWVESKIGMLTYMKYPMIPAKIDKGKVQFFTKVTIGDTIDGS